VISLSTSITLPQAQIAAILDDDEVFFDALARPAGEQAADLLQ
jgi:hypothetical protein